MIPKILHQTAPDDITRWHPVWRFCQKSWTDKFIDFQYDMWYDYKVDAFIKRFYPEHYTQLRDCPASIIKIDMVRYMILFQYGGIYADMDMYCYKNFYEEIDAPVAMIEMASGESRFENSLLASIPRHVFWDNCIKEGMNRLSKHKHREFKDSEIKNIAGPGLVTDVYEAYTHKKDVYILTKELYNMGPNNYDSSLRTRHMLTGMWGKEVLDNMMQWKKSDGHKGTMDEYLMQYYEKFREIDVSKFEYN